MAPKSIPGIEYFPHLSAPVPQGLFWKVPCLILAPFCLHFGRFWHPFGSTWVASGTFFVSIFDNFALTLFYFGTRARRAPDSAAAPAEKTKETSSNNLYFAQHLSTRPRAEPCLWQPGLIDQRWPVNFDTSWLHFGRC